MSSQTKHGVKGRVYLTAEEAPAAARQFGCARFVYNHLLEFSRSRYFINKTKTSPAERSIELTRLKSETPWLQEVNAQALQQTGRALDTAYQNWFDSITGKRPDKVNPPKFKKKSKRQSARFTRGAFRFDKNSGTLSLSKIGDIAIPWYRRVKGEPSSVVLSRTPSGRYHVSFQVEQPLRVVGSAQNFALSVDINTKTFNFFNGRTWSHQAQAHVCETGNIVGDVRQCRIVTPKNPPPLGVGSLQLLSNDCSLAFTRNGLSNSVISPQPLPRTGSSLAESGLCHLNARLAMSPMMRESCSALMSPGSGTVSRPVPHTAE